MGKFDILDDKGREKVQCKICGCFYHRLEVHLKKRHKKTLAEYESEFPGEPTMSKTAKRNASKSAKNRKTNEQSSVPSSDGSSIEKKDVVVIGRVSIPITKDEELNEFDRSYIPKNDELWMPGTKEYKSMEEIAVGIEDRDNIFIYGPHGSGKTTLIKQLGALTNTPVFIFNIIEGVTPDDFIGSMNLSANSDGNVITEWKDGMFTHLWERGFYIVFDEITASPANLLMRLHSVLDGGDLCIFENNGRIVKKHPRTRFFATDNTNGRGDDTGMYVGTNLLNEATLDRFGTVVEYTYTEPDNEKEIITNKGGVTKHFASKMVAVANKIREAYDKEECYCTISTRRLIDWAKKTERFGDVRRASEVTILNKLNRGDKKFVNDIIQHHFGGTV
jgi:cobaltochelatase CobS